MGVYRGYIGIMYRSYRGHDGSRCTSQSSPFASARAKDQELLWASVPWLLVVNVQGHIRGMVLLVSTLSLSSRHWAG